MKQRQLHAGIYHIGEAFSRIEEDTQLAFGVTDLRRLSSRRKADAVKHMESLGVLELRGAVNWMAHVFGVSRVSIYPRLTQFEKEDVATPQKV